MDEFTKAFIEAMFFTESGEDNLKDAGFPEISESLMKKIEEDCASFQEKAGHLITRENCFYMGCSETAYAGHDFWLTRNGHGCGFWDGDWNDAVEDELTAIAKSFGQLDVYLGDDGKVYA